MTNVIGVGGVAGSGKDTFYSLLKEELKDVRRFALADNLRNELRDTILESYGIDVWNCSRAEKDKVRPLLVSYADTKRKETQGKYWTSLLQPAIEESIITSPRTLNVITDVRFAEYAEDEIYWLRNKFNGVLVHITRYIDARGNLILSPPNDTEAYNDPLVRANADFIIEWPTTTPENLRPYVTKFIEFLQNKNAN